VLKLLQVALQQQDDLALQAVDMLGDMKTKEALDLFPATAKQRKLVSPIIDKLYRIKAVQALESLLQDEDIAPLAKIALVRITQGRTTPPLPQRPAEQV
jgi:hypothetical protein